ncbi:hypothetical protein EYF80_036501 [Liparis tanakae]|uniref:Uncharacterized protein n=1 Tax=Liparis tanakae TaxID=230148 RepID=A0A4Z2GID4_9TELE|nr:hypothetical protein EYF80_036501 [Liparis tanakae]
MRQHPEKRSAGERDERQERQRHVIAPLAERGGEGGEGHREEEDKRMDTHGALDNSTANQVLTLLLVNGPQRNHLCQTETFLGQLLSPSSRSVLP